MKKIFIIIYFLWHFFPLFAFSQDRVHLQGGLFLQRMENNMFQGQYNLKGKGDVEKLFFGDFNAMVEFTFSPSFEAAFSCPPFGFRIVSNSSNTSCILELKYVSNYEEAHREASKKHPSTGLSPAELSSISASRRTQIMEHNRTAFAKQEEEKFKLFKIENRTFPVSNQLAEKLHENMLSSIVNFEAKEVSDPNIVPVTRGGYSVTFRIVVGNAVLWSLCIQNPEGNTLELANLCRRIITDSGANQVNEKELINQLDEIK